MAHSTWGEHFVGLINYLVKVFLKEVIVEDLPPGTGSCLLRMRSRPARFLPRDGEKEVLEHEERF